jgi:hypothetical protein
MGFGKLLKKLGKIAIAPVKNIAKSTKSLVKGDIKGALKHGTRAALAPISLPAQIIRNAPGVSNIVNRLPGANRLDAGLDKVFGNPNAARPAQPAVAALDAFAAGGANLIQAAVARKRNTNMPTPAAAPAPVTPWAGSGPPPPPQGGGSTGRQYWTGTGWHDTPSTLVRRGSTGMPAPAAAPAPVAPAPWAGSGPPPPPTGGPGWGPKPEDFDPLNPQGVTNFAPGVVGRGRSPRNAGGAFNW